MKEAQDLTSEPSMYTGLFTIEYVPLTLSPGWMDYQIALELQAHGAPRASVAQAAERAVAWCRQHPPAGEPLLGEPHMILARSLELLGRDGEADTVVQAIPTTGMYGVVRLGMVGVLAARRGDRAAVKATGDILASLSLPYFKGTPALWRAQAAAVLGDRAQAVALLQESIEKGQIPAGSLVHHNPSFSGMRDFPPFRTLLQPREPIR